MGFSQKLYDHWRIALIFYFASSILESILLVLFGNSTSFIVKFVIGPALLPLFAPGALYILGEYTRISGASSSSLRKLSKTMEIGFVAFIGFGLAVYRV